MSNNKITGSTIFITGGAGFVASHLLDKLLSYLPAKVILVDNLVRGSLKNIQTHMESDVVDFIEGDIRDRELLEKCVAQADFVFHMAALRINSCAANPSEGVEVMVSATQNLVELCKTNEVKKLIFSSSASVYGLAQNFPTPETDHPYDNQTIYGGAKLWAEQLLRSYHFMYGLNYVALRYFNVYGERMDVDGKYTEVMIKWLDCIRDGRNPLIFGDGSDTMDFVHVKDVAEANIKALLSDHTDEVYNVGSQRETSLKELLTLLLEANNSRLFAEHRPSNAINPVSRRLADVSKIKSDLAYSTSITLEEGLKDLSNWYFALQKSRV